ncbi:cobyric acid synthase [Marivibrio halodurans]|uniref:Cobyric acid synthase n=1 Tax=Marivibrio halodurans TaxID=2039722 RepID=A0A8J7S4K0_9PROT|nr:cobyric acid synthase [Marivibrio halodurans]MBP5858659.1 cobyric acid synthase [Marivibrio halodurans]
MTPPAIMLQGTGSDVGKSLLTAGLARAFRRRGLSVAPFKPQNMSNNAAVTPDGGEIGRAQALQARAAGLAPSVDMNPVLLKPQSDMGSQIIVQGRVIGTATARDYYTLKDRLLSHALESFERLGAGRDLLLVEGAGSPAEVNLRAGDIANMGFAEAADLPVLLVADIERGGVIASLIGTHAVIAEAERRRLKGYIVNKFRGDITLFDDGLRIITERTGLTSLGVLPYFTEAGRLPAEDAVALDAGRIGTGGEDGDGVHVVVPRLGRIANYDDLDPLRAEPTVRLTIVMPGQPLPGDADLVLLPGSKTTLADLAALRAEGWDIDLLAHHRRGGHILGLCGGYQMLGTRIADPEGIEGPPGEAPGLGLLDVETVLKGPKTLSERAGTAHAGGASVAGYEMHMGVTDGPDRARPFLTRNDGTAEGAVTADGRVAGTYLHGLFASDAFRRNFLAGLRPGFEAGPAFDHLVETTLDRLADHLEAHLSLDRILEIARAR